MRHVMKSHKSTDPPLIHTLTFDALTAHCTCGWASSGGYDSAAGHKRAIAFLETMTSRSPLSKAPAPRIT